MQSVDKPNELLPLLQRIADALEVMSGQAAPVTPELGDVNAYSWDSARHLLVPVGQVNRVPLDLLKGVEPVLAPLLSNTLAFARGHGANNALLWGARGTGKSSLVKAVHAHVDELADAGLRRLVLVEINREDLESLPILMRFLAKLPAQFILFCDDLSFDKDEASYKSLKAVLDGGLEGRPGNVVLYATSNRRHLMPRDMIDNERSTAINPSEAVEEKVSLSDRFGLWLGFHNCDQDTYLEIVAGYVAHYDIEIDADILRARAIEWSQLRGARSGRVAIQLVRQLAGEAGKAI